MMISGNSFEAIRADVPWRVSLYGEQDQALDSTPRPANGHLGRPQR